VYLSLSFSSTKSGQVQVDACGECISYERYQYSLETICLLAVLFVVSQRLRVFPLDRDLDEIETRPPP
jgi:hypothetical protein